MEGGTLSRSRVLPQRLHRKEAATLKHAGFTDHRSELAPPPTLLSSPHLTLPLSLSLKMRQRVDAPLCFAAPKLSDSIVGVDGASNILRGMPSFISTSFNKTERQAHQAVLKASHGWTDEEKMAALRNLFPTIGRAELTSVLDRTDGDVDSALNFLFADGVVLHEAMGAGGDEPSADCSSDADTIASSSRQLYLDSCIEQGVAPIPGLVQKQTANTSYLSLRNNSLTCRHGQAMTSTLARLPPSMTSIDVSGNTFGTATCSVIVALCENKQLLLLDLSRNNLGWRSTPTPEHPTPGSPAVDTLVDCIYANKLSDLQTLRLASNNLGDRNTHRLADSIMAADISTLDLSRNDISIAGGLALGEMIEGGDCLTELDLSWNQIRLAGACAIGRGLAHSETLKKLNLEWNGFCDDGAEAIGVALASNTTIYEINLSNNRIGEHGALQLASGLKMNDSCMAMHLRNNPIGLRGGRAMVQTLHWGKHPNRQIDLEGCDLSAGSDPSSVVFDRSKPNGKYRLDLSDAYERSVATELLELARAHGSETWINPKINGQAISFDASSWELPPLAMMSSSAADADGDGKLSASELLDMQKAKTQMRAVLSLAFVHKQRLRGMSDVVDKTSFERLKSLMAKLVRGCTLYQCTPHPIRPILEQCVSATLAVLQFVASCVAEWRSRQRQRNRCRPCLPGTLLQCRSSERNS